MNNGWTMCQNSEILGSGWLITSPCQHSMDVFFLLWAIYLRGDTIIDELRFMMAVWHRLRSMSSLLCTGNVFHIERMFSVGLVLFVLVHFYGSAVCCRLRTYKPSAASTPAWTRWVLEASCVRSIKNTNRTLPASQFWQGASGIRGFPSELSYWGWRIFFFK